MLETIAKTHPAIVAYVAFSILAAFVCALKVLDESKSPLKATIAFLSALMSIQGLLADYLKGAPGAPEGGAKP